MTETKRKLEEVDDASRKRSRQTPPRKTSSSSTPSQGVAIQIPSRPATPATTRKQNHAENEGIDKTAKDVDESEWAAFEADIAAASASYEDATISAPAMTAEESAAAKEEEEKKPQVEVDIEEETEDATRAMEDEFDEMTQLDARLQKLKDQREAIARRTSQSKAEPTTNGEDANGTKTAEETKEESESESEPDDDWDGFRFRKS